MKYLESSLYALLRGSSDLAALVGDRIYPGRFPESTPMPAVSFFKVDGPRIHSLVGPSGLATPRFQFDVYAGLPEPYKTAKLVANQLRTLLDGYRGEVDGVFIQAIILLDESDSIEEGPELARVTLDFQVWHNE